jgi:hypothetical protein
MKMVNWSKWTDLQLHEQNYKYELHEASLKT